MADEITRTFIDGNSGFGGLGSGGTLGAGFIGGLVLGGLWNGGFGGNRFANAGVGYDTGALNAIQGQLNNVQGQIANADRDLLMQVGNQNQFVGNLVNSTGDAIVSAVNTGSQVTQNAISDLGQNVQNGIYQNTLQQVQSSAQTNLGMSQGFCGVTQAVNMGVGLLNNNITSQGYESRLQSQQLANQAQQNCCAITRAIEQEGCANRELQREIQQQQTRDVLATIQAENQSLKAQLFSVNQTNAQTNVLLNAINSLAATSTTRTTTAG